MAANGFAFGDPKPSPDNFDTFNPKDIFADSRIFVQALGPPAPVCVAGALAFFSRQRYPQLRSEASPYSLLFSQQRSSGPYPNMLSTCVYRCRSAAAWRMKRTLKILNFNIPTHTRHRKAEIVPDPEIDPVHRWCQFGQTWRACGAGCRCEQARDDGDGLRRLYERVAKVLECDAPSQDSPQLAVELAPKGTEVSHSSEQAVRELDDDRGVRLRLTEALNSPKYKWRTLERVAIEAAISEERAGDLLRSDPSVRFSKGKSQKVIVGLSSRVK